MIRWIREWWPAVLFGVFALIVILGSILIAGLSENARQECQVKCKIKVSHLIDGTCFCATETGWERAP